MARKAVSSDQYRLAGTYERLRNRLQDENDANKLDRALSYWVLPTDRRLPIIFLQRTLRDILSCSLEILLSTPGVGRKKTEGLFDLLHRVNESEAPNTPFEYEPTSSALQLANSSGFDPTAISEAHWAQWCETVRRYELGGLKLGRIAASLQNLPTVIWHTKLSEYLNTSLANMRQLKTHGEKRVQAILEIYCNLHEAFATVTVQENLDVDLLASFVSPTTRWLLNALQQPELPSLKEIEIQLVQPLLQQIRIDLGEDIVELATSRLRFDSSTLSVKQQADKRGVTRARIYQLLEDCSKVMEVRWPEGRWLLLPLTTKIHTAEPEAMGLIHAIYGLFYPQDKTPKTTKDLWTEKISL